MTRMNDGFLFKRDELLQRAITAGLVLLATGLLALGVTIYF